MSKKQLLYRKWPAASVLSTFLFVGTVARAPSMLAQTTPQDNNSRSAQDRDDTTRRDELVRFDRFLDSHREIAEQLRKDPTLVDNKEFIKNHPALQTWLQQNPEIRQDLTKNSGVFMHQENRYDSFEDRRELANFDRFLDNHREAAQQLHRNPSLADNQQFLKDHPDLQAYLQDHPEVRQALRNNPNAFMQREDNYESRENQARRDRSNTVDRDNDARPTRADNDLDRDDRDTRDRDTNRRELANFDRFLDAHREAAEQLRKKPSLADDRQFLKNHPDVQTYLQDHPQVREELKENPNAFMERENRYDARENQARYSRGDSDMTNRARQDFDRRDNDLDRAYRDDRESSRASFNEFLDGHSEIARQLSKNPSLVKRDEYLRDHPELQQYLDAHPTVRQQLMADPQHFLKSAQQFSKTPAANPTSTTTTQPKPKQ
jgi:hypothetical protein